MGFRSFNLKTNKLIASIPYDSKTDILNKISKLNQGSFEINKNKKRKETLQQLEGLMNNNRDNLSQIIYEETGKNEQSCELEVKKSISHIRYYINNFDKFNKPKILKSDFQLSTLWYQPLGCIFKIAPFNFPLWTAFKMIAPNICLGNSILLRPPETCPLVGKGIETICSKLQYNILDVVYSDIKDTEFILSSNEINGVSFTGSVDSGKIIGELAGKYLKKSCLELGGSDPFIAFKDINIDKLVELAIKGRLSNTGQVCCASKRFIIEKSIWDDFIIKLVENLTILKNTENKIYTHLSTDKVWFKFRELVEKGIDYGDELIYGDLEEVKNSPCFEPLVFKIKDKNSPWFKEETFGPLFAIDSFETKEEALDKANDSEFGLSASIHTNDKKISDYISNRLEVGMVFLNSIPTSYSNLPWGGIKNSGFGRDSYKDGYEYFSNIKIINKNN